MNVLFISVQKKLDVIGLKYLHYYLLEHGFNSHILFVPKYDARNKTAFEQIRSFVERMDPGLMGMSLMSNEFHAARDLTSRLKSCFPSVPFIWGGVHPTIDPETCLQYADLVGIGECERTVLDLANALSTSGNVKAINNLCYMENGTLHRNPLYPLIEDLDSLPVCDHIPVNSHILHKNIIAPVDRKLSRTYGRFLGTMYNVISSRGCPFSCTYCANNYLSRLYGKKNIRRRSIASVISEIEKAVQDYPEIEYVNFHDDCFLSCSNEYLREFCDLYAKKINKAFIARCIPAYINLEKMRFLKETGLAWIFMGLQSGSNRVLKEIYKRKSGKEDFLESAKIMKELNIASFYDIILDNPFEKDEELLETIHTLMETPKPYIVQLHSLSFYMGTELYDKAMKECPEQVECCTIKDYGAYEKHTLNEMMRMASFINIHFMNILLRLYNRNPDGMMFKTVFHTLRIYNIVYSEPMTYLRVISLARGKSITKILRFLSSFFSDGIVWYLYQFKAFVKR